MKLMRKYLNHWSGSPSRSLSFSIWFLWLILAECSIAGVIPANPSNYFSLLGTLQPGDTLLLEPGQYDDPSKPPGLPFFGVQGTASNPITIMGDLGLPRPVLLGRSTHNTVRFDDASYIVLRHLEIDGRDLGGDGVKAQGTAHHITLEDLYIHGVGSDQQIVGISTKAAAWNWIVRFCTIEEAGTGIYFGDSDGSSPFIAGLIEHNFIFDSVGYNAQIKHQNPRPATPGIPTNDNVTIIRDNVFSKAGNSSIGANARPNLLVGHVPLAGPGTNDQYLITGNFFYQNPTGEPLFQGEGNIALHNNVFVNHDGPAVWIQPHNDVPRDVLVFYNTVIATETGIRVIGGSPQFQQAVIGNASFASIPFDAASLTDNIGDTYSAAGNYVVNPFGGPGAVDLYPLNGALTGSLINSSSFAGVQESNHDFNDSHRSHAYRGAYSGAGSNPGWPLSLAIKPVGAPAIFNLSWGAQGFCAKIPTWSGRLHGFERSPDVVAAEWIAVTNVTGNGAEHDVVDPTGGSSSHIYRTNTRFLSLY